MRRLAWLVGIALLFGCSSKNPSYRPEAKYGSHSADSTTVGAGTDRNLYTLFTYSERKGKILFEKYCAVCHGREGRGDGFNAWNLDPRPRDFTDARYMDALSDERLAETIREGGRGVNKSVLMPAWGGTFTEAQIEDLVSYLRTFARRPSGASESDESPTR